MGAFDANAGADQQAPEPSVEELLKQLVAEQQEHREELAAMRAELAKAKTPAAPTAVRLSPEELLAARMDEVSQHSHYCPGCGLLYDYPQKCTGREEAGHSPIEVVSTDELKSGDPSKHTAAPDTTLAGFRS